MQSRRTHFNLPLQLTTRALSPASLRFSPLSSFSKEKEISEKLSEKNVLLRARWLGFFLIFFSRLWLSRFTLITNADSIRH